METASQEKTSAAAVNGNGSGAAPAPAAVEKTPREVNPNTRRIMVVVGAVALVAILIWGLKWFAYARTH